MNIFVGNLSAQASERQVENLFTPFGQVSSVKIITDNFTHRSRGFAFVEMPDGASAQKAIDQLHNTSLMEQPLTVNEAKPRTSSSDRFSGRR